MRRRAVRRVFCILPLLFFLLAAGCVTLNPRSAHASPAATVIPDMPMLHWGVESCGAGSLATVLEHYGDPKTLQQWDAALPKTSGGVLTIDLILAARQEGYEAKLITGTPELIANELREGRPVILMLQVVSGPGHSFDFYHYIVADGFDERTGLIRTQFGDGRAR